jgi:hypothetical protein
MLNETKAAPVPSGIPREFPTDDTPVYVTKSNFFRVIHIDGFFGGGTPTPGNIMMTVYNHRVPFPEKAYIDFMGNEAPAKREGKTGIEHEYEASLVMSLATAKAMQAWLNNAIASTELLLQQMQHLQQRNQQK